MHRSSFRLSEDAVHEIADALRVLANSDGLRDHAEDGPNRILLERVDVRHQDKIGIGIYESRTEFTQNNLDVRRNC